MERVIGQEQRMLLRVPEVAERLGLGESTVWQIVARGELRVVKVGRATRIPIGDVIAWVERQAGDPVRSGR